jgi:hypothetical protein
MFSSTIMMLVIFRAVQLDRTQKWFQTITRRTPAATGEQKPRRRRA